MNLLFGLQGKAAAIFAGLTFRLILLAIIAAMFVDSYVEVRIPIPLLPDIHWIGWKPLAVERGKAIKDFDKAQKQAGAAQQGVNDAKQDQYDSATEGSEHEKPLVDIAVRDAVAEYIRTHRVPSAPSCPSGRTDPAAEGNAPGVVESVPAVAGVLVSEPDLQKLSDAAGYAVSCHNWAVSLEKGD